MANSTHAIPAAVRREMLELLQEAVHPATDPAVSRVRIQDVIEMLQLDDLRSGYAQRFWQRVVRDGRHMIWTGAGEHSGDGRPVCEYKGKRVYAAKVAWLLVRLLPVPDDMSLVKQCNRDRCISPECHEQRPRSDVRGRPFSVRRDLDGRPLCRAGIHVLKRDPRPREHVYCPGCEQQKRIDHAEAAAARMAVGRFQIAPGRHRAMPGEAIYTPTPPRTAESQPDEADMARRRAYVYQLNEFIQTHGIASGSNLATGEDYADDDPRVIEARAKLPTLPIPIEFARSEYQPDAWRMTWLPGAPMPPLWPIPLLQRDNTPVSGAKAPVYEISDDDLFK